MSPDVLARFGAEVRRLRVAVGLSQESLAERCGLDRTYIGGIERGERNVGLRNIAIIAAALGVPISELTAGLQDISPMSKSLVSGPEVETRDPDQQRILEEIASTLRLPVKSWVAADSSLLSSDAAKHFRYRLLAYHATHTEILNKKGFEFAFQRTMQSVGRQAEIVENAVNAGADIIVDGSGYSLKTEASKRINPKKIKISKFAEARWIRDCSDDETAEATSRHVLEHLTKYKRMFVLRAFVDDDATQYELDEIPLAVLCRVSTLRNEDFERPRPRPRGGRPTGNGNRSRGAWVKDDAGNCLFRVFLDGSVEKIQIQNLDKAAANCITHAWWRIPVRATAEDEDRAS